MTKLGNVRQKASIAIELQTDEPVIYQITKVVTPTVLRARSKMVSSVRRPTILAAGQRFRDSKPPVGNHNDTE
jgi:hypothetical protein